MVEVPIMDESKLGSSPKAQLLLRRHANLVLGCPSTVRKFRVDGLRWSWVVGSESRVVWSACQESGSQFARRDRPNLKRADQYHQWEL